MRKLLLIGVFLISGCAWMNNQKSSIETCWSDQACRQEAITRSNEYGNRAADVAAISGVPWAKNVAQNAVGYGSLVILLSTLGAALKKKKQTT